MTRGTTLLKAVGNGRGTFVVAGGLLGIGLYGFVATFEPYASGRVLEPLRPVDSALVAAWTDPIAIPPAAPEVVATADVVPAAAPPLDAPSFVRTTSAPGPTAAPAPVEAAGGDGGVTPLAPAPEPTPGGLGPVIVDPPAIPSPTIEADPPTATPAEHPAPAPNDDADGDTGGAEAPGKPSAGGSDSSRPGKSADKSQGKARGHSK